MPQEKETCAILLPQKQNSVDVFRWFLIYNTGSFENLKLSMFFPDISFRLDAITDRFWNQFGNSLQFSRQLKGSIKWIQKISLVIKVLKNLFLQMIDGLNSWWLRGNLKMPFKISENISKSLNFSLLSVDQSGDQCLPKEFQEGVGGTKENCPREYWFSGVK